MKRKIAKIFSVLLCLLLIAEQSGFGQVAAQLNIASHLAAMHASFVPDKFRPLHLRYLEFNPQQDGFRLLVDKGDFTTVSLRGVPNAARDDEAIPKVARTKDEAISKAGLLRQNAARNDIEGETKKLLNYFFIGVSLPNDSFWVNLRPDSPDNIIDDYLAQTDIGKILLEADLQLKKDTASFTSPQTSEGREYWDKLYKKAEELFGYENVTIPTLTRPWIVPGEIIVRESTDSAYIYKATLKVMLEEDYLSGDRGQGSGDKVQGTSSGVIASPEGRPSVIASPDGHPSVIASPEGAKQSRIYNFSDPRLKKLNEYSSQLIRELIIPKITKEVNTAKRYAPLRQVYYSLILAQWFKERQGLSPSASEGTVPFVYSRLIDSRNLTGLTAKEPYSSDTYFSAYQQSFKDGEYKIEEPHYTPYGQTIRSYFSGGVALQQMTRENIPTQNMPKDGLLSNAPPYTTELHAHGDLSAIEIESRKKTTQDTVRRLSEQMLRDLPSEEKDVLKRILRVARQFRFQKIYLENGGFFHSMEVIGNQIFLDETDVLSLYISREYLADFTLFTRAVKDARIIDNCIRAVVGHEFGHLVPEYNINLQPEKRELIANLMALEPEQMTVAMWYWFSRSKIYQNYSTEQLREGVRTYISHDSKDSGVADDTLADFVERILAYEKQFRPALLDIYEKRREAIKEPEDSVIVLRTLITDDEQLTGIWPGEGIQGAELKAAYERNTARGIVLSPYRGKKLLSNSGPADAGKTEYSGLPIAKDSQPPRPPDAAPAASGEIGFSASSRTFPSGEKRGGPELSNISPVYLYEAESMPTEEKIRYSRFKLGDSNAIEKFAGQILVKISEEVGTQISVHPEDWVLVGGPSSEPKNCAYYLCNILKNRLGIARAAINRKRYEGSALYTQSSSEVKRKIAQETLYFDASVTVKGKNVIFVDDCFTSGGIYARSREILLEKGAKSVMAYIITRINNPIIYPELGLDRTAVTEGGIEEVLRILKEPRNVITSRLITILSLLTEQDVEYLARHLNKQKIKDLAEAIVVYYGSVRYPKSLSALCESSVPGGIDGLTPDGRSPSTPTSEIGGIDFRFLPIVTQSLDNLKASIRAMPRSSLEGMDLTREWSDIERLVNAGITPSAERLKDYLAASCFRGSLDSDIERIVSCIADILRMEEESCCSTDPTLKDILVVLGSARSAGSLKAAFSRVIVTIEENT